ncbi:MAG: efflux RND transporter permease subunit, partial [Thermodesulfobacteriota bacterium]
IPFLFATGLIGEFLSVIPTVAIFSLLFSLGEALLIMPYHCADWLRPKSAIKKRLGWFHKIRRYYIRALIFVLGQRYVVVPCFIVIFFITLFIFIRIPNVMFYQHDTAELRIRVENPSQSSIEYTTSSVKKIEDILQKDIPKHVLKNIVSLVGLDLTGQATVTGDHIATIIVQYEDFEKRKENAIELSNVARDDTFANVVGPKQVDYIIEAGLPTGKPVEIRIQGNDINTLKEISYKTQKFLEEQKGVSGISDDLVWGKPEVRVEVDERKASIFGLDTARIAKEVRTLVDGLTVAQTRIGKEEADINLRYQTGDVNFLSLLESHQIQTPTGGFVALGSVANIANSPSILDIKRYDSQRAVTVKAEVDQKITTSVEANKEVKSFLESVISSYPGYSFKLGGEAEEYKQTMGDIMRAALAAIILIYLILASILRSYFQPLIIMSILPFTLVGVITGVLIRGEPITLPAIIGMVALLGIVVNDSLVLMDFINKRVLTMKNRVMAVVFSAKHRFRPIILTTLTTFGGLSSLMFVYRGESSFLAPMAISLGFGLLFATLITLVLIPALYLILDDFLNYMKGKLGV